MNSPISVRRIGHSGTPEVSGRGLAPSFSRLVIREGESATSRLALTVRKIDGKCRQKSIRQNANRRRCLLPPSSHCGRSVDGTAYVVPTLTIFMSLCRLRPKELTPSHCGKDLSKKQKSLRLCVFLFLGQRSGCLLYTSPSPRDLSTSRMPSSA